MELALTINMLNAAVKRLSESSKQVFRLAQEKAETERTYRIALGQEIFKLRVDKVPATLIPDLSRAEVAELKFQRDLAADTYRSGLAAMEALKAEINALQSILRYQNETGG